MTTEVPEEIKSHPPRVEYSRNYTHYVLGMLTVVYVFNFIDRQIFAILAQSIKTDLGLSDTQLGALGGVAFGIFYATLGIPIARLADRYSRVNVITISLTVWSAMTALQAFAGGFWQLLLARIGVGVGEAGGSPPSHSLLADYFPSGERAGALGIYALGIPIGILFGNMAGGWINEFFGWRNAFLLVGIPGVLLAIVFKRTVKEPARGHSEGKQYVAQPTVPFSTVVKTMWSFRSFRHLALGAGTQAFVGYGSIAWMPAFLERVHGLSSGQVGTALGLIIGIFGAAGTLLGGKWADRLGARDQRWYMWLPALSFLLAVPFSLAVFLTDNLVLLLCLYAVPVLLVNVYTGPTFGTNQTLAPVAMRAAASAFLIFIINMIGLVCGPIALGALSDVLQTGWGMNDQDSLRYALLACSFVYLISATNYFFAARTIREDLNVAASRQG